MLEIESILNYICEGLLSDSERFEVIDDEHVLDTKTGVKLHAYDDWFKITRDGETIATMQDFDTGIEQPIIWQIKGLITDPEVTEQKKLEHMVMIKQRRKALSELFESPEPIENDQVITETGTTKYTG